MPRSRILEERSLHPIGSTSLDREDDLSDTNHVSNKKYKANMLEHVELLDDEGDDDGYIGTQKEEYKANNHSDEIEQENYKVDLGGHRSYGSGRIPESYWDQFFDDLDDDTEDDDE